MTLPGNEPLDRLADAWWLDLDAVCRAARVDPQWVHERVLDGLLTPSRRDSPADAGAMAVDTGLSGPPEAWRFDAVLVRRVRCMARIERDFDARPELAALVADMADELARLRARLAAAGLG
jgi:chaperone modulatory protein CbpM